MKLTETTRQIRLQQWYHLIQEQKSSGLTVEKWCVEKSPEHMEDISLDFFEELLLLSK